MRRATPFLALGLCGCDRPAAPPPATTAATVEFAEAILRAADPDLVRVVASPVPGRPNVFVAICDTETEWWGTFQCVECTPDGRILWKTSDEIGEQSVHKARAITVPGFANPLIEVFGITHMGNGSLYLYELRGQSLHRVLETRAVDRNDAGGVFHDTTLTPHYADLNADGHADLTLTGVILERTARQASLRSTPCRKVFLWHPAERRFVEDPTARLGFEPDGE
jgi:hypothetical protein